MAKKDLNTEFPLDPQAKKKIIDAIEELVDSKIRVESEKDLQKSIFETTEEKYKMDKAFIKAQAELLYDARYDEGKKAEKFKQQEEQLSTFEAELSSKV